MLVLSSDSKRVCAFDLSTIARSHFSEMRAPRAFAGVILVEPILGGHGGQRVLAAFLVILGKNGQIF